MVERCPVDPLARDEPRRDHEEDAGDEEADGAQPGRPVASLPAGQGEEARWPEEDTGVADEVGEPTQGPGKDRAPPERARS